ncbi:uncharacterized protein LOC105770972 [Gossypium raimondii]|uniref:DUF7870 domain-containing protein n=1 Tax=Gossypium raimondii TaxID=29730 RepID=A0A0D2TWC9_GOSRA|nr:uncharacterized protein LOC105770972 [Gossypium raimondii]KJB59886.1 hypothetical protein B456_009G279400 [Gossypium raimondii]MBA0596027.1 hypothetical protein [Gossypium raimondii]
MSSMEALMFRYGGGVINFSVNSWFLKLLARLMAILVFATIVLLPWSGTGSSSIGTSNKPEYFTSDPQPINPELLPLLFHDLNREGILKQGEKGLMLSNDDEQAIKSSLFSRISDMEFSSATDLERQRLFPNESLDFIFTQNFTSAFEFIDRTLKVGGFVAVHISERPSYSFEKLNNYRIVYFRKFKSNVLVMKKIARTSSNGIQRQLFGSISEARRQALKNLEDVLLEPPRSTSRRSKIFMKRTKYLPDLLGDTLESYPRRVFIDVGLLETEGGSGTNWFAENYPTRNLKFDIYKIETLTKESSRKDSAATAAETGMSNWLRKNVKETEYVVMKAEAEVVEDMVKTKAIRLVDELFLECKPRKHGGRKNMSRRAYWECLALYGKLRDEGVAVHQWWG